MQKRRFCDLYIYMIWMIPDRIWTVFKQALILTVHSCFYLLTVHSFMYICILCTLNALSSLPSCKVQKFDYNTTFLWTRVFYPLAIPTQFLCCILNPFCLFIYITCILNALRWRAPGKFNQSMHAQDCLYGVLCCVGICVVLCCVGVYKCGCTVFCCVVLCCVALHSVVLC